MEEFIWIDWNLAKIDNHALSEAEVEFAWRNGRVVRTGDHPENGPFTETEGECPSGRTIRIVWRYDVDRDGETKVFVITAY
ncbi:MAG TPA: DUF4258 domain-containing protein [Urbifossiella sp.]|jgi:hypothetical protein|nr:DUF4258 domain-containing protein [Urbifossiella sp.]